MVIRFCRVAGLSLETISTVLADRSPNRTATRKLAADQVLLIDDEIAKMQMARRMMVAASVCGCPTLETCECGAMDDVIVELREYLQAQHEAAGP